MGTSFLYCSLPQGIGSSKSQLGCLFNLSGADLGTLWDSSTLQVATRASWIVACARDFLCFPHAKRVFLMMRVKESNMCSGRINSTRMMCLGQIM